MMNETCGSFPSLTSDRYSPLLPRVLPSCAHRFQNTKALSVLPNGTLSIDAL